MLFEYETSVFGELPPSERRPPFPDRASAFDVSDGEALPAPMLSPGPPMFHRTLEAAPGGTNRTAADLRALVAAHFRLETPPAA